MSAVLVSQYKRRNFQSPCPHTKLGLRSVAANDPRARSWLAGGRLDVNTVTSLRDLCYCAQTGLLERER